MNRIADLIQDLPDAAAAQRFLDDVERIQPSHFAKLLKNEPLLSDVLTIAAFSPLLATTLLSHPEYYAWLDRQRRDGSVRSKEILLESLGRFALTNSTLDPAEMYAKFRRRELLRIYLRDIRHLATVAEITEEISNVADAVLENALAIAERTIDERFGMPLERDAKGRSRRARFCVVALGKLGSKELNYASDVDLLFVYSNDGETSGTGIKGNVTNREYFVKLGETLNKLVGGRAGEGGAYRVDLRLRPHGSMGALAMSAADTVKYYRTEARPWERQVLIRSRSSAGDANIFRSLMDEVEDVVFVADQSPRDALAGVKRSKIEIDKQSRDRGGFNVKLGRGGIREIEFLAQALQLAYGGRDRWLRAPHTLISLARLAERGLITAAEYSDLSSAYELLRRTEHILQMENGVQTHTVPDDQDKRQLVARRVQFAAGGEMERDLGIACDAVNAAFRRVFGDEDVEPPEIEMLPKSIDRVRESSSSLEFDPKFIEFERATPHFAAIAAANERLRNIVIKDTVGRETQDCYRAMLDSVGLDTFREDIAAMRRVWAEEIIRIAADEVFGRIDMRQSKDRQTALAEGSIAAALKSTRRELERRFSVEIARLGLGVLALGKLGSKGLDYGSDLDLVLIYDPEIAIPNTADAAEFYGKAAELFVTSLSSMTRDGNLYRVDLRLRPFGSQGQLVLPGDAFINYFTDKADIWELLAYVKLRAVGGDLAFVESVETRVRTAIHERAKNIDPAELAAETLRVRKALEKRSKARGPREIDIKYDAGGLLDIYFAVRYLQLRHDIRDDQDRSTSATIAAIRSVRTIYDQPDMIENLDDLATAHKLFSANDHLDRLTNGRRTRSILERRHKADSDSELDQRKLTRSNTDLHLGRLSVRAAFELIVSE